MKNLKNWFQPHARCKKTSAALLLMRLIMGTAFILHGLGKIQNPFGWMGPEAPVPGIFQFLAALSEFGGGISLILGLLVPLFASGLAFTMLVATSMHMFVMKDPFVNPMGGSSYELALTYFGLSLVWLTVGPGKFSLDKMIFGERPKH